MEFPFTLDQTHFLFVFEIGGARTPNDLWQHARVGPAVNSSGAPEGRPQKLKENPPHPAQHVQSFKFVYANW